MNKLPRDQRDSLKKLRGEREKLEKRIGQEAALLESSGKGVLQENVLEGCIRFFHRTRLEDGQPGRMSGFGGKRTRSLMLDWLGISMLIHGSRQMEILDDDDGSDGSLTDEISDLDYLARATEVLSLAEPMEDEDVSSEDTDGDGDMADVLQVTEEAEQVQAERMMEGDNMHKHIQNARRRLAATQRLVLAYVAGEDQEKEEEGKPDDYDEGWEITPYMKKKLKNMVNLELQKKDHMLEGDARRIMDLWTLPNEERWSLYRLWLSRYQSEIRTKIHKYDREYQRIVNRMEEVWNFKDETLLQSASVIGMTTTCAARNRRVLQNIQPRIVVVEEAAEVLEAHIVTTLTSACQHLILIGDHQQLRPSCTVYELATTFKLEVSLFERLIHMDVPYVRLDSQHRMRPEISRLLTPHIYKNLKNHVSVNRYENIKGYEPSQITVLTTYTGQLHCLKKIMTKSEFRGVLLSSVDRYQGEENDIIILSLVRSNKEGKTGFLKIPNRVCVALSRAKKGLFCIGNMTMLSSVPLWSKIINTLRSHEQVGEALMLRCENHPATLTPVSKEEDFHKVPLGGCELPCVFRLACGHVCTKVCHPADMEHKLFKCVEPCPKTLCQDGHRCPKRCHQECGECQVLVTKTIPRCGHKQKVPCSLSPDMFTCRVPCDKMLACGHKCIQDCGETCTWNCPQKVTVDLACGHQIVVACYIKQKADSNGELFPCMKRCKTKLDCGHPCPGNCFQCKGGTVHLPCASACDVQLICSHLCPSICGQRCAPCSRPCDNLCYHKKCPKPCAKACEPCTAPCGWCCKHHRCALLSVRYGVQVKTIWLDIEAIKRKAATKWGKRIQSEVKEREEKGIKSPKIPPLLYKLPMSDLGGVAFISKQIKLLSTLVEIKNNVRSSATMRHLEWINRVVDICSEKITTAKYGQLYEYEIEVEGILCLAEAEALSDICTETFDHWKMNKAIETLRKRGQPLAKQDVDKIKETLIGVANKINPLTKWKMTEDTEGAVQEYDFLKLSHWYKCTQGHICYRQSADSNTELCPQCLMRQGL
ncbi:hypothetical protein JZ751_000990 [Albula glossodonta]|uniref:NFX1-type zinc finger-containing protein 1 n=1 Tax=Albula glossodonta TaxID=121402 RepID=A0A8T2PY90_9TELE|nr:hypothetical protein JZ751_000990 [Albula glossodonta]